MKNYLRIAVLVTAAAFSLELNAQQRLNISGARLQIQTDYRADHKLSSATIYFVAFGSCVNRQQLAGDLRICAEA